MDALIYLAEAWWPLYAVHFVEVSLFILLVWAVDRWMTLDTRLRYVLYLLALAKVFVPPFYAIPLPEFLTVSDDVPIGLEDKVEGLVLLQCVVNIDSSVSDIAVMKSFNTIERKEFQQAAIDAVSQYRFKPAEHNGKPVAVLIPHGVAFRLPKE